MSGAVERYLAGLAAQDWRAVGETLAPDVERIGPYGDVYRGRGPYVAFLASTLAALSGYTLEIDRVVTAGRVVAVELTETVDDRDERLRTAEAVVFDLDPTGLIARIAVYLRRSEHIPGA